MSLLFSRPGMNACFTGQLNHFNLGSFGAAALSESEAEELLCIVHPCSTLGNTEETVVLVTMNWGQEALKDTLGKRMQSLKAVGRLSVLVGF